MRVQYYEGLCRKTAARYCGIVQEEYEDLVQVLRTKCWRALESFDPAKSRVPVQNYVFSCVRNQIKDLLKRKRRNDLYIEEIAPTKNRGRGEANPRDRFEAHYLLVEEDEAFAEILIETPLIPSTLNEVERQIVVFLYLNYQQADMAERLGITRRDVAKAVKSIKSKMADWRPGAVESAATRTEGVPS